MYTDFYFIEEMLREKERQLLAEADRLRLIKSIDAAKTYAGQRKIGLFTDRMRNFRTVLLGKREQLHCGC